MVEALDALPFKVAEIVPAEKPPEPSLCTIVEGVLSGVALVTAADVVLKLFQSVLLNAPVVVAEASARLNTWSPAMLRPLAGEPIVMLSMASKVPVKTLNT
jgi:hypothetical protein